MERKQIKVYQPKPTNDPTPYEMARREGKSTKDFLTITVTLLVVIPAFVYCAATVADPFMKHPLTGPIATAGILYMFWQLLKLCEERWG